MAHMAKAVAVVVVVAICIPASIAHFHVLMPQKVDVQPRSTAQVTYWVGHPFEHILADAGKPAEFFAVSPEGQRQNLLADLMPTKMKGQEGKEFAAWQATVNAVERGDYIIGLIGQPTVEEGGAHQAIVKTTLHARVQKGWDRPLNLPAEFVPLTRPYGLRKNMVFQVQLLKAGKPVPGATVELEMYNEQPVPEDQLPAEEYITHAVKTDANGIATFSLLQAGWWGITAEVEGAATNRNGKSMPLVYHPTYWVFVGAPEQGD